MTTRRDQVARAGAIRRALRRGEIERSPTCARCGRLGRVIACHVGADEPEWLCASCHKAACPRGAAATRDRRKVEEVRAVRLEEQRLGDHGRGQDSDRAHDQSLLERAVLAGVKRQKTKEGYLVSVRSFVRHAGADPRGWNGEAVERWRDYLRRTTCPRPRSVNVRLGGLKYASRRLAAMGWGADFAAGAEPLPAPTEKRRRAVSHDTAAALVRACEDDHSPRGLRDRAILIVGFRCGARREGIVNMDFSDVGPGRRLTIVQKGGARHEIPAVDDEVLSALGQWMDWLRASGISSGPVFRGVTYRGRGWHISRRRLCPESVNAVVKSRAAEAGVSEHVHPHLMRHSFVSWQVAAGVPDRRIMVVTGHRDPGVLTGYTTDVLADNDPIGSRIPSLSRRR